MKPISAWADDELEILAKEDNIGDWTRILAAEVLRLRGVVAIAKGLCLEAAPYGFIHATLNNEDTS